MSAPSHRVRIRSSLKSCAEAEGAGEAAMIAVEEATRLTDAAYVRHLAPAGDPNVATAARAAIVAAGGLLGVAEACERLKIANSNIGKVAGLEPVARTRSGPVFLGCEVDAAVERLEASRARRRGAGDAGGTEARARRAAGPE